MLLPPTTPAADLAARKPVGIILSGGPRSVCDPGAPKVDQKLFDLGVPTLGICYGMQLMTDALGGRVEPATSREYGHAVVSTKPEGVLFKNVRESLKVWASHGDFVAAAPPGTHRRPWSRPCRSDRVTTITVPRSRRRWLWRRSVPAS